MLGETDFSAIILTLKLAAITTIILLLIGTPVAWWLARSQAWWKGIVSAIVMLPIVLPPTVIGFYLLLAMGFTGMDWPHHPGIRFGFIAVYLCGFSDCFGVLLVAVCGAAVAKCV